METLDQRQARRLALLRGGLLKPRWSGLPSRARGRGRRARRAAQAIVERFGYLQLDSVAVAGARSHVLVLLSRLGGFDAELGEALLAPGEPLFEYWGHEASWLPLELYPTFAFRRRDFAHHPWWGDLLGKHPRVADALLERIAREGPLRSLDLDADDADGGYWTRKVSARVALAFWSRGDLAIRERRNFQRTFDLAERVIPEDLRARPQERGAALATLLLRALAGLGWATTGTLANTWRLRNLRPEIQGALARLQELGLIVPCRLVLANGAGTPGWIRCSDLEDLGRLSRLRPARDRGVLLSPFDPLLWDRQRVATLFGFDQVLEIFKPQVQRRYGYYCLPVLAGEHLVARVDLKADRRAGRLDLLALHYEAERPTAADRQAVSTALARHSAAVGLEIAPA
jgi:uncharacterized protein YcaQ